MTKAEARRKLRQLLRQAAAARQRGDWDRAEELIEQAWDLDSAYGLRDPELRVVITAGEYYAMAREARGEAP